MELTFHGANALKLRYKGNTVVVDDNLAQLGASSVTAKDDISLFTQSPKTESKGRFVIDGPGEYEIANISVIGIAARGHMDEADGHNVTMYKLIVDDFNVLVTGHIYPELSEQQLEKISTIDVMVIPVGGNGYTLDAVGALKIIKKIEPKIIVPTYYADSSLKFEVPPAELDVFLHEIGMEAERLPLLKLKSGEVTEVTKLVVLERQ